MEATCIAQAIAEAHGSDFHSRARHQLRPWYAAMRRGEHRETPKRRPVHEQRTAYARANSTQRH
eukprot:scaffold206489_cov28-Tisochrysis_lutea.AAC.6